MDTSCLKEIGLTEVEIQIYLDIVKNGESSAAEIAKRVEISRTYIYDALEHLLSKGIISYVLKNNRKRFRSLDLDKLLEFVDNKKRQIEEQRNKLIVFTQELGKLSAPKIKAPKVEVLEGSEGLKTILNDIVRTEKEAVGWGATDKIRDYLPSFFIKKYLRERDKSKIKVRQLAVSGEGVLKSRYAQFKKLPKEFDSPVTFGKYGEKVIIFFWSDIPVVIRIENKQIAYSFEKYFEILWKGSSLK